MGIDEAALTHKDGGNPSETAQSARADDSGSDSPQSLAANELRVLQVFQRNPARLLTNEMVLSELNDDLSRGTVIQIVKSFVKDGFLHRPGKGRSGAQLTDRAMELLEKIGTTENPQLDFVCTLFVLSFCRSSVALQVMTSFVGSCEAIT